MAESNNIIINDTLQSKQISLAELANSFKNYQSTPNVPNKKALIITLDDPHKVEIIPDTYYTFGSYDYNVDPDPRVVANNSWQEYHPENAEPVHNADRAYGTVPSVVYPNLAPSLLFNDGTTSTATTAMYFYRQLTDEELNAIQSTGIGVCEFKVASPWKYISRQSPYIFGGYSVTNPNYLITRGIVKNSQYNKQQNFVSFGKWDDEDNPSKRFRFIFKICVFQEDDESWSTYIHTSIGDTDRTNAIKIEGWDGMSLKHFKCTYAPNLQGSIRAALYLIEDGEEILLRDNISPSGEHATYKNAPEFGNYSYYAEGMFAISYFNFKAYVQSDYRIKFDTTLFEKAQNFLDFVPTQYNFNVVGSGNIVANWGFAQHTQNYNLDDNDTLNLILGNYQSTNQDSLKFFSKKNKLISFFTDGEITEFVNPHKNISRINLIDFPNINKLDLSFNKLDSIDLSQNIGLNYINLSNNPNLSNVILPIDKNGLSELEYLNVINTQIKVLEVKNSADTSKQLTLLFDNPDKLVKLTLEHINLANVSNFVKLSFPLIESVDISHSNILTNKSYLEQFLQNLPDRTGKTAGLVFLYGPKYTINGVQGSDKEIAATLEIIKNKNWLFYL